MTDNGMLSQDEIDALLKVSDDTDDFSEKVQEKVSDHLSSIEEDTLGEIGNISFGSSATTLSTLLNQKVEITTPKVSVVSKQHLQSEFSFEHVSVQVNYEEGFIGENLFIIKSEDAAIISDIMLGGDGTDPEEELTEIHLSAVQEAMNQMMGAAATSMSTIFGKRVNISPPSIKLVGIDEAQERAKLESNPDEKLFVKVSFQLKVGQLIDSKIMQLIPFPFANELVGELLDEPSTEDENKEGKKRRVNTHYDQDQVKMERTKGTPVKNLETNEQDSPQYIGDPIDQNNATIQPASFSNFEQVNLNQREQRNLDMLLDIPLKITVELGRTKRPIKDILDLSQGSIIELDKLAGEPVDILVNEKLIAKGEVVVIDENFGVRVTDIISQTARLMKLK